MIKYWYPLDALVAASEIGLSGGLLMIDLCDSYDPLDILLLSLAP